MASSVRKAASGVDPGEIASLPPFAYPRRSTFRGIRPGPNQGSRKSASESVPAADLGVVRGAGGGAAGAANAWVRVSSAATQPAAVHCARNAEPPATAALAAL